MWEQAANPQLQLEADSLKNAQADDERMNQVTELVEDML